MVKKNSKLYIVAVTLIVISILISTKESGTQTVAPECFTKEDCRVQITLGYCDVDYSCDVGRCYSQDVFCPEICNNGADEDFDGYIDCKDTDCWGDINCHCNYAGFNDCLGARCYCPTGGPIWIVQGDEHWCECG